VQAQWRARTIQLSAAMIRNYDAICTSDMNKKRVRWAALFLYEKIPYSLFIGIIFRLPL
jgi:hypothetical protein